MRPTPAARSGTAGPRARSARGSQSSDSSPPGAVSVIARRIDLIRADLTFEIPPGPDRLLDLVDRGVADRLPGSSGSARAAPGRPRRGCGRWSTATARSGSAPRSDAGAAAPAGSRRPAAAGHGSPVPAAAGGLRQSVLPGLIRAPPSARRRAHLASTAEGSASATAAGVEPARRPARASSVPVEHVAGSDRADHRAPAPRGRPARLAAQDRPVGAERDHDRPGARVHERRGRSLQIALARSSAPPPPRWPARAAPPAHTRSRRAAASAGEPQR